MKPSDLHALHRHISQYYSSAKFRIPELERREFGYGNEKKIDARHLSFPNEQMFRNFLVSNPPLYVSHSAAYYERPAATPIEKKGWLRADLIFDLDIHAEGRFGAYAKLDETRESAIRLIEEFLLSDFGLKKEDLILVFSGNRGYHVHVRDLEFSKLGPYERREIAKYVAGLGLNYRTFFSESERGAISGPNPEESGYRGRFSRRAVEILEKEPEKISVKFKRNPADKEALVSGIRNGNWGVSSLKNIVERFACAAESLPLSTVDADAAVTYDTSRLIRVPESIHGETCLVAKIIDPSRWGDFSPLDQALAFSMSDTVSITIEEDVPELRFGGQAFAPMKNGEKKVLPKAFGIFLVAKGCAGFA
ncbi:MAG: DNA primase catalytic subunit PriS [Candidatus Bilamarchaeaceae archaeon]